MRDKYLVLVTGANTGFGFAISASLVQNARYHVIMAVRSLDRGRAAIDKLQASGPAGTMSLLQLDTTSSVSIASAAESVAQDFGRIDVLINNAGLMSKLDNLQSQLRETFELNTFAPALVTECFMPLLQKSDDPRVIHISGDLGSISLKSDEASRDHLIDHMAYRMSKAALNMMTACHTVQFKPWGCKVWSYNPGFVVTDAWGKSEEARNAMKAAGAGNPYDAAHGIVDILERKRDTDIGGFLHRNGIHPW
ncbi:hypothetical protein DL95DRAFT_343160 [Leptodontidium sp. 2 PMI_412]|nr:short chain dehydrogenase [Leptodontidium sp. MPI-SDFR-AT-0119]KAH9210375.1 hypothetical protein DL95DRAFT_343160 [Leptodontidium sp. 2 PMI_412]